MNAMPYTPAIRAALLAALHTPSHTLQRTRDGFVAAPSIAPVSRRCANGLWRDGLFEFDNPACPSTLTLTEDGLAAARQLQAQQAARPAHA
jgi:hypothetical protein